MIRLTSLGHKLWPLLSSEYLLDHFLFCVIYWLLYFPTFSAYDEIAANPTVEQTIRVGSADVEMVVQAANNQV